MARFDSETHPNGVSAGVAWQRITDLIRDGAQTVEIVERSVGGAQVWEIRAWDGIRADRSNARNAPPGSDY